MIVMLDDEGIGLTRWGLCKLEELADTVTAVQEAKGRSKMLYNRCLKDGVCEREPVMLLE